VVGGRTDVHVVIEKEDQKFLPEIKWTQNMGQNNY
jgi:hypothetical protein